MTPPYALFENRRLIKIENLECHYDPEEIKGLVKAYGYVHVSRKIAKRLQNKSNKKN